MNFRNYKHLLRKLSETHDITVRISVYTYRSGRMKFKAKLNKVERYFDGYMIFNNQNLSFVDTKGKRHRINECNLKFVKVDSVDITKKDS